MDTYLNILGMEVPLHDVLRWMHIILAAYWLGGEWGVFNASTFVADRTLTLEERRRHMKTAVNIDILPRSAIIWLLPVGFHMADNYGLSPISGNAVPAVWALTAAWWWFLIWGAYKRAGTEAYVKLTKIDNKIRWVLIPSLMAAGLYTMFTGNVAITGAEAGQYWFAFKMAFFGWVLIIGLYLRYVMTDWVGAFRQLEENGPSDEVEDHMYNTLQQARIAAYIYWISIGTMAFVGVTKAF